MLHGRRRHFGNGLNEHSKLYSECHTTNPVATLALGFSRAVDSECNVIWCAVHTPVARLDGTDLLLLKLLEFLSNLSQLICPYRSLTANTGEQWAKSASVDRRRYSVNCLAPPVVLDDDFTVVLLRTRDHVLHREAETLSNVIDSCFLSRTNSHLWRNVIDVGSQVLWRNLNVDLLMGTNAPSKVRVVQWDSHDTS